MRTRKLREKAVARIRALKRYPSDLTDDEWSDIASPKPTASRTARPRGMHPREAISATRYPDTRI
jgi:hypothetical protein